jgi:hypothetical protein
MSDQENVTIKLDSAKMEVAFDADLWMPQYGGDIMSRYSEHAAKTLAAKCDAEIHAHMMAAIPSGRGPGATDHTKRDLLTQLHSMGLLNDEGKSALFAEHYGGKGLPANFVHSMDCAFTGYTNTPKESDPVIDSNDVIVLVYADTGNSNVFKRSGSMPGDIKETVEEFENRVQRAAAKASAASGADTFVFRAAQVIAVPVTIRDLDGAELPPTEG